MKRRQWCQMEIQQAVRKVEALVKEKGNRFAALEWVGVKKGKMEVMVMDKVVAEILVEQQPSNTLGHPSLTVAASCSIVASLSNSKSLNTQSQSLLRRRGSLATTLPSP